MVNPGERVINVVNLNQPTLLTGWSQNGTGVGRGTCEFPRMGSQHSRRRARTYGIKVSSAEHGKPVALPHG
ncbi:MAG: hypothetical protein AVDCRST_MAG93-4570 [uncultured Chloroflexia bacterium]|uniref:Uncharacterized protein n=1 Tax=uncultured Chloroflexia bacterium TaxID=1672391 RepID=A0A6J4KBI6_9CHLR|nr:MAG: hypothetical protein AVDCRST_MAG93-4570 [uncultured Chloroflexia bacterium]